MVKIDMGAHIDGYIVLSAHTLIVGMDLSTPEAAQSVQSGRRAAVINAAYTAAEVAAKLIKNGTYCVYCIHCMCCVYCVYCVYVLWWCV